MSLREFLARGAAVTSGSLLLARRRRPCPRVAAPGAMPRPAGGWRPRGRAEAEVVDVRVVLLGRGARTTAGSRLLAERAARGPRGLAS